MVIKHQSPLWPAAAEHAPAAPPTAAVAVPPPAIPALAAAAPPPPPPPPPLEPVADAGPVSKSLGTTDSVPPVAAVPGNVDVADRLVGQLDLMSQTVTMLEQAQRRQLCLDIGEIQ